ncbi:hypothetical protein XU18_0219 [Perkinsela sp. CCAP 1560/4]|nr:hypothetical protein XU18_0219 [Perkinsela sp. CCAP 1560/4]|eukprot:KNH09534.1 hypothetical protein XU18_0219 [Perkinsela sp. CCAP 1560/4]
MLRAVVRLAGVTSGLYVVYHVFDHPVVKADALALFQGTHAQDTTPSASVNLQLILRAAFERWAAAFSLQENGVALQSESENRQSRTPAEEEIFEEKKYQQCAPFGSYADTNKSKLLRFAIPHRTKYSPKHGIFTVSTGFSSPLRHSNDLSISRFIDLLLFLLKKIICAFVPQKALPSLRGADQSPVFEDRTVSLRDEFFPLCGGDGYCFDIHTWKSDSGEDMQRFHNENHTFFFQLCQRLYFPDNRDILLIVDPIGVSGALQLLENLGISNGCNESVSERPSPPTVRMLYVKPNHWNTTTAVDKRLQSAFSEYQRFSAHTDNEIVYATTDYPGAIQRILQDSHESTTVVALLTEEVMRSFKNLQILQNSNVSDLHVLRISLV